MSEVAANECKRCIDNDDGMPMKGRKHSRLPNDIQMYRCPRCGVMWGVDKNGERLDGRIS